MRKSQLLVGVVVERVVVGSTSVSTFVEWCFLLMLGVSIDRRS